MENQDLKLTEQLIKQVILSWTSRNVAVTHFFNIHNDDEVYSHEVAPGRNRAIYLLGHLIATNDALLVLFDISDKLFPELEVFSRTPDKTFEITHTIEELKKQWDVVNTTLTDHFNAMTTEQWFERHMAVSPEDFAKDPQRNKLNVLLGRTNHQSYHLGQLNLLTVEELVK